jgi:hypothetical protein
MQLTADQTKGLQTLIDFCQNPVDYPVCLVIGSAGVGKTTLMQKLVHALGDTMEIGGLAPTHKAKRVLAERTPKLVVKTVASFLMSEKKHTFIGTNSFRTNRPSSVPTILILDESSMVTDVDYFKLVSFLTNPKQRMICIGDPCQIPPVSQGLEVRTIGTDQVLVKREAAVFNDPKVKRIILTQIVRQQAESVIIQMGQFIRDHLNDEFNLATVFPEQILSSELVYETFKTNWLANPLKTKLVTYTNASVVEHNKLIRRALGYTEPFHTGEILMGYQQIGFPLCFIENGADYIIETVTKGTFTFRHLSKMWTVYGYRVRFGGRNHLFPMIDQDQNASLFQQLLDYASRSNRRGSTKEDYKRYKQFKDKILFHETLYYFQDLFLSARTFKEKHPLLFIQCSDFFDDKGQMIDCPVSHTIMEQYEHIVLDRISEAKPFGDDETFASRFCIVEKDLDYGYAYTTHKSQASSLVSVFIDETNMNKLINRYNPIHHKVEFRVRERNQLKYVAVTRAMHQVYLLRSEK